MPRQDTDQGDTHGLEIDTLSWICDPNALCNEPVQKLYLFLLPSFANIDSPDPLICNLIIKNRYIGRERERRRRRRRRRRGMKGREGEGREESPRVYLLGILRERSLCFTTKLLSLL